MKHYEIKRIFLLNVLVLGVLSVFLGCDATDDRFLFEEMDPSDHDIAEKVGNMVPIWTEDTEEAVFADDLNIIIVMEARLILDLASELVQYYNDIRAQGFNAALVPWHGGTVEDLRSLLKVAHRKLDIDGAWLIGDLPTAWYEQRAFEKKEEFPFDIYLMDLSARWSDSDGDSIFDSHSEIDTDIFISRLQGSVSEIQDYFVKIHNYRLYGANVEQSAHIFKDDDWAEYKPGKTWELEKLYTVIDAVEDRIESTRESYVNKLTGSGAEYVYQWIHANAETLIFSGQGGGALTVDDIAEQNLKGAFYNLFDCSAARFTQTNVAMTYLTETDFGLATIGSTKAGGVHSSALFHKRLADGETWGEAYRKWYNGKGKKDDEWYLGIVIFGDPLLALDSPTLTFAQNTGNQEDDFSEVELKKMAQTMRALADTVSLGTFDEYRNFNPSFFEIIP